jgi:hypothetical protein
MAFSIVCAGTLFSAVPATYAQSPFVTDDVGIAGRGVWHVEVFNEYDWLSPEQIPHLRQNTFNMRLNVGLGRGWEADLDSPLLTVTNTPASSPQRVFGSGDTNLGLKYHLKDEDSWRSPALAVVGYVELPTGDTERGLGSGLTDVWVYTVAEKRLPHALSVIGNLGYLFAGNTSTGVLGIQAVRGHVVTLSASLTRVVSDHWSTGAELSTAIAPREGLQRGQLQMLVGGIRRLNGTAAVTGALVLGRFAASPRVGLQGGFTVDLKSTHR